MDPWSDIDLALRLAEGVEPLDAAERWTADLRGTLAVADVLDLREGSVLYRVLLLADSLQVDLSFRPADAFRSDGQPFRLLFGQALAPADPPTEGRADVVGWAWLYALHTRSAIARDRPWRALEMLGGLRDRLVALACLRRGLPAWQGRGVDRLPAEDRAALLPRVPRNLDGGALAAAFRAALALLEAEARAVDPDRAAALVPALAVLRDTAVPPDPEA